MHSLNQSTELQIRRAGVRLTMRLLEEIRDSITVFKPSKSLTMLSELAAESNSGSPTVEIDLVLSGGGLKGYFVIGCVDILLHEMEKRNIKIARIAGASVGAWSGLFICAGITSEQWLDTYYTHQDNIDSTIHENMQSMWYEWMREYMPADTYKTCCGRLFISITVLTPWGFENQIISEYYSNEDLFEACMASSTIPFFTERSGARWFRGRLVLDGGFTNNVPVFTDHKHRQFVLKLSELDYSPKLLLNASDECIEVLVLRGALLTAQFLQGAKPTGVITWLNKEEGERDISDSMFSLHSIVTYAVNFVFSTATVTTAILVYWNYASLESFFEGAGRFILRGDISAIPFPDVGSALSTFLFGKHSSIRYNTSS